MVFGVEKVQMTNIMKKKKHKEIKLLFIKKKIFQKKKKRLTIKLIKIICWFFN